MERERFGAKKWTPSANSTTSRPNAVGARSNRVLVSGRRAGLELGARLLGERLALLGLFIIACAPTMPCPAFQWV